jgi:hypothetical protein
VCQITPQKKAMCQITPQKKAMCQITPLPPDDNPIAVNKYYYKIRQLQTLALLYVCATSEGSHVSAVPQQLLVSIVTVIYGSYIYKTKDKKNIISDYMTAMNVHFD